MIDITNATDRDINELLNLTGAAILEDARNGEDVDLDEETLELFNAEEFAELLDYLGGIGAKANYLDSVRETYRKAHGMPARNFSSPPGFGCETAILKRQERQALRSDLGY